MIFDGFEVPALLCDTVSCVLMVMNTPVLEKRRSRVVWRLLRCLMKFCTDGNIACFNLYYNLAQGTSFKPFTAYGLIANSPGPAF